jgi:hypothetical protein
MRQEGVVEKSLLSSRLAVFFAAMEQLNSVEGYLPHRADLVQWGGAIVKGYATVASFDNSKFTSPSPYSQLAACQTRLMNALLVVKQEVSSKKLDLWIIEAESLSIRDATAAAATENCGAEARTICH